MACPLKVVHPTCRLWPLPMGVGDGGTKPLAAQAVAVRAGHLGRGPGLIDEHQALRLEVELPLEPCPAPGQDIEAVLLGGVRGLYGWPAPHHPAQASVGTGGEDHDQDTHRRAQDRPWQE
jgi:hypothetical protein